jgi:protein TonB
MWLSMRMSALISVVAHVILMMLISLLIRPGATPQPEEIIPVRLVQLEELPPEPPAVSMTAAAAPAPMPGPGRQKSPAPAGGINPEAPKPKRAPAPPKVLTAKGGEGTVPEGKAGATGTEGTGTEPAGPTYGPGTAPGPLPVYPKNALDQNLEGTVTLAVTVSPEGKAVAVHVTGSSGSSLLDEAARRAVARWGFIPGMKNGKPAEGVVSVKIRFANNAVERLES